VFQLVFVTTDVTAFAVLENIFLQLKVYDLRIYPDSVHPLET